jgi:hypothetical protein
MAEIFGGIGVIFSLLFVALSIKQNTEAIRATTWETFLDRSERINVSIAESSDLARIVRLGESDPSLLDPDEYFRFSHFARMRFGAWEAVHNHYAVGRIDLHTWNIWNSFYLDLLDSPGYRRVWKDIEQWYEPEFRSILQDKYLRKPPS